jgi:hypothetical protein
VTVVSFRKDNEINQKMNRGEENLKGSDFLPITFQDGQMPLVAYRHHPDQDHGCCRGDFGGDLVQACPLHQREDNTADDTS